MADDKTLRGAPDRARISIGEQYEVNYFATKYGLTTEDAKRIILKAGHSRDKADAIAELTQ